MNGIDSSMSELRLTEKSRGNGNVVRNVLVILLSLLVWTLEVFLIVSLRASQPPNRLSMWYYSLPLFHLLPWAAGLQALRKIKRGLAEGTSTLAGTHLAYEIVISLLTTTYVVLGSVEAAGMLTYRLSALHSSSSLFQ